MLFTNSGKQFLNVTKDSFKVEYSNEPLEVDSGWNFNSQKLKDAVEYLIRNTYIEFGSLIPKQIRGIPMGSIPAPNFANLALGVGEYKFVKAKIVEKNCQLLRKMNFIGR